MKNVILLVLISIVIEGQTRPLSCEEGYVLKKSDQAINQLSNKICTPTFGQDPDEYLHYENDIKNKSVQERLVYEYTYFCYSKINSELRKTTQQDLDILNLSLQLDIALCNYPNYIGEAYRGIDLPEDVLQLYLNSKTIVFPSFTSASKKHTIGCDFAKNTLFKIHSKNGRDIIQQSKHKEENEILFRLNSKFKVIDATYGAEAKIKAGCNNKNIQAFIELEELEN